MYLNVRKRVRWGEILTATLAPFICLTPTEWNSPRRQLVPEGGRGGRGGSSCCSSHLVFCQCAEVKVSQSANCYQFSYNRKWGASDEILLTLTFLFFVCLLSFKKLFGEGMKGASAAVWWADTSALFHIVKTLVTSAPKARLHATQTVFRYLRMWVCRFDKSSDQTCVSYSTVAGICYLHMAALWRFSKDDPARSLHVWGIFQELLAPDIHVCVFLARSAFTKHAIRP